MGGFSFLFSLLCNLAGSLHIYQQWHRSVTYIFKKTGYLGKLRARLDHCQRADRYGVVGSGFSNDGRKEEVSSLDSMLVHAETQESKQATDY